MTKVIPSVSLVRMPTEPRRLAVGAEGVEVAPVGCVAEQVVRPAIATTRQHIGDLRHPASCCEPNSLKPRRDVAGDREALGLLVDDAGEDDRHPERGDHRVDADAGDQRAR